MLDSIKSIKKKSLDASLLDATKSGSAGRFRALLRLGADVDAKNYCGQAVNLPVHYRTPIRLASACGYVDVVRALLDNGANADAALHEASLSGHVGVIDILIKEYGACVDGARVGRGGNDRGEMFTTPLHAACWGAGQLEAAKALIRHGANVNAVAADGTPLHVACSARNSENIALARMLLENGADVQARGDTVARGERGCTPLHVACRYGHVRLAMMLIDDYGADVDAETTGCKSTPLHWASDGQRERDSGLFSLLVGRGANVHAVNAAGMTPIDFASRDSAWCKLLEAELARHPGRPSPLAAVAKDGSWSQTTKGCSTSDSGISLLDTRLRFVTMSGYGELREVRWLLEQGAKVNTDKEHMYYHYHPSPLQNASANGNIEMVRILLENGADVRDTDFLGRTPLHHAFSPGHMDVVDLLVEYGADVHAKDTYGVEPVYRFGHRLDENDYD